MRRTAGSRAGRHAGSSSMHEAALENRGAKCPGRRVGRGAGRNHRARGHSGPALRQAGRVGAGTIGRARARAAAPAPRSPRQAGAGRRRAAVRAAPAGSVPARGRWMRWGWWWSGNRGDMAATEGAGSRRIGPPQAAPGTPGAGDLFEVRAPSSWPVAKTGFSHDALRPKAASRARSLGWAPRRGQRPCITLCSGLRAGETALETPDPATTSPRMPA